MLAADCTRQSRVSGQVTGAETAARGAAGGEAVAGFAFGFAWIIAGLEPAAAMPERAAADMQRLHGPAHPDTLTAKVNLASAYRSAGRTDAAVAIENQIATLGRVRRD